MSKTKCFDESLKEESARAVSRKSKTTGSGCAWSIGVYGDFWDTDCGNAHIFLEGGPAENYHKFCPYCGRALLVPNDLNQTEGAKPTSAHVPLDSLVVPKELFSRMKSVIIRLSMSPTRTVGADRCYDVGLCSIKTIDKLIEDTQKHNTRSVRRGE